jgi:hypothetical protein
MASVLNEGRDKFLVDSGKPRRSKRLKFQQPGQFDCVKLDRVRLPLAPHLDFINEPLRELFQGGYGLVFAFPSIVAGLPAEFPKLSVHSRNTVKQFLAAHTANQFFGLASELPGFSLPALVLLSQLRFAVRFGLPRFIRVAFPSALLDVLAIPPKVVPVNAASLENSHLVSS